MSLSAATAGGHVWPCWLGQVGHVASASCSASVLQWAESVAMLLLPLALTVLHPVYAALCMHMLVCMFWLCLPITHCLLWALRSGSGHECFTRLFKSLINPFSTMSARHSYMYACRAENEQRKQRFASIHNVFQKKEQGLKDHIQALEQQLTEAQQQALAAAAEAAAQFEGQAAQAIVESEAAAAELAAAHNRTCTAEQRAAQVSTGGAPKQQQPAQAAPLIAARLAGSGTSCWLKACELLLQAEQEVGRLTSSLAADEKKYTDSSAQLEQLLTEHSHVREQLNTASVALEESKQQQKELQEQLHAAQMKLKEATVSPWSRPEASEPTQV